MVAGDDWGCRFIEVAHGVQNRNQFIRLDDLEEWRRKQPDDVDLYSSFFRYYTDDPNLGAVLAGFGMDFDDEQNPERARKEALTVIKYLMDKYDIKEFDISIAFSGNKGFHVFVNRRVFGIEPHYWLHKIFKSMAEELIKTHGLKTLDLKIYERRRLIRLMNSRHSKSGLYKIPLTLTELEKLNIDKIRSLAVRPRPIAPRVEHVFSEKAHNWFLYHKELVERQLNEKRVEFTSADLRDIEVLPCVKKRLEIGAKEGERNRCTWQLASYFCKRGLSLEECLKIMRDWWSRVEPGLNPYTWDECERSIRKVYEVGGYLIGCGSEFIEGLCVGKDKCPIFQRKREQAAYSEVEIKAAEYILTAKDPLEFILEVVHLGHAGDDLLIKAEYISALSAALASSIDETINIWGIGRSGTGKTHSLNEVLKVLPKTLYETFTSTSPKAYFYFVKEFGENALADKLLFIDEVEASADAEPVLRALTSRTEITPRHLSVYDSELLDLKIRGKRAVWFTSTRIIGTEQLHNRFLFVNPEEEQEQDERVFNIQREKHIDIQFDEAPYKIARCMTEIIIRETKDLPVFIPFEISWPFKQRRYLYPLFLSFIKIIAKTRFRKRRREQGFLIAEREDFETAKEIWRAFEETIVYRVSSSARKLLELIPKEMELAVTHAELAEKTGYSTKWISTLCNELLDAGLINRKKREKEGKGRNEWEYWRAELPSINAIEITGEMNLDEFKKNVEIRRIGWKKFIEELNFGILELKESGSQENEFQTKNDFGLEPLKVTSEIPKFRKSTGGLKPTGNPLLFLWRRVPPAEKCEFCGAHPVEFEVATEDAVLRRCPACFEEMRRLFMKVEFREAKVSGC